MQDDSVKGKQKSGWPLNSREMEYMQKPAARAAEGVLLGDDLHHFSLATRCLTGHHKDRTHMPPPPRPLGRPSFRGSPLIVGVEHGDELMSAF